ncbi:UDP-N-acetylmuramoyl-L-alanyl-D-glutamate--2,6-diaminopimelate ligase [Alkalicoccus halolimnae]|uniref:UDP-N-acetylmuramoyl-L-alanyl-D-glutamate--2, 6-diaminopimelate ligase n=1 Tax=Alkalicoccus halolimnae TaxID=1667239 RepID=A0A5C7FHM8_9BACI|nr:UDP-N-acetylmuramoyl-L-alanyl-D-glutamate--2,6-diaminopimelate ligase [Alkalicoccus halolimnae]TXF83308.1 UDP-N-acetylmuramoyl-L-alanyl-D-glutamate--2,6-diaminopimelate ligase [Alkalicoccus halolimnae]
MRVDFTADRAAGIQQVFGRSAVEIDRIAYDSRSVTPGTAFFCILGSERDGHAFIDNAAQNGAAAVIGMNASLLEEKQQKFPGVSFILAEDSQRAMSYFSQELYGYAYKNMHTIAVTGTNGKTTVTSFVRWLLNQSGIKTGSIGTEKVLDHKGKRNFPHSTHTTPEAPDLHYIFHKFFGEKLKAVVLEVTSIAIEQRRVDGMMFDIGVLTNLTPEHIDYHDTFEQYKAAKMKLFHQVKKAVVNLDDEKMGKELASTFAGPVLTYSMQEKGDVRASIVEIASSGTFITLFIHDDAYDVFLPFFGTHNIANFMAAVCSCMHMNLPVSLLLKQLPGLQPPAGRFQFIDTCAKYRIISDFAHTPDALKKVITSVKQMNYSRLILLIAGNGVRDKRQLPELAEVVQGEADITVVAVEHPDRSERREILIEVLNGFTEKSAPIYTELYRDKGVEKALSLAGEGDLVLLTGLGSLDHQVIEGVEVPYAEIDVIHRYLKASKDKAGTK